MLKQLLCHENNSLLEALRLINTTGLGAVFITDDDDKMTGLLTDGDIRREILKGVHLDEKAGKFANRTFTFGRADEEVASLLKKVSDKIKIIPILDETGRVVDHFLYDRKIHLPVAEPTLQGNEFNYLVDAFLSTWISSAGHYLDRFQKEFPAYVDCEYGVATSNGTVAIHLALAALGIGPGDEVIVPDLTFGATINAVLMAGAAPVIVDIEEDSWCIDPVRIREAVTTKTKAIIPVHLYGQACDMDAIMAIAKEKKLFVIEDCAEAHGAMFKGKKVGSFGDIGTYSFFGNKIITTGEGGMCVTHSEALCDKMKVLRDHGMNKEKRYWHDEVGFNYRMTNLQASLGTAQLEQIDQILKKKVEIEESYRSYLGDLDVVHFQKDIPNRHRVIWLVCAWFVNGKRDAYLDAFKAVGVDVRPFFYPLSDMPVFKPYTHSNRVSREIAYKGINLPSVKPLTEKTADIIRKVIQNT